MGYVIRIAGRADGQPFPNDLYVREFDASRRNGRGELIPTPLIQLAKQFRSPAEAVDFWQQQSRKRENIRPLTVFKVKIEPYMSEME
jgi:hypothetical protein